MQQGLTEDLYQQVQVYRTNDAFTPREKLAIEFAERFAFDQTSIGDELFGRLREHFTDGEILELTVTAAYCVGVGRAFLDLDVARDFDVLWAREKPGEGAPSAEGKPGRSSMLHAAPCGSRRRPPRVPDPRTRLSGRVGGARRGSGRVGDGAARARGRARSRRRVIPRGRGARRRGRGRVRAPRPCARGRARDAR